MSVSNNLPSPSAPFLGPDGNISLVWWQFLLTVFNRTGAGQGVDASLLKSTIAAVEMQANEGKADAFGALLRRIAEIDLQVAEGQSDRTGPLLRRIADLEMQIEATPMASPLPLGFANVTIAGVTRRIPTY